MTAASLSGVVLAADDMSPEAIAERIKPVGQVYTAKDLEGIATAGAALRRQRHLVRATAKPCSRAPASPATMQALPVRKRGDKAAWEPRIAQGIETLKKHAIAGFAGKTGVMPPRGTCATCSDEEIENAIHYMIDKFVFERPQMRPFQSDDFRLLFVG